MLNPVAKHAPMPLVMEVYAKLYTADVVNVDKIPMETFVGRVAGWLALTVSLNIRRSARLLFEWLCAQPTSMCIA